MNKQQICKICYFESLQGEEAAMIEKYKAAIKEADRVAEEKYNDRLGICSECDKLNIRTCTSCGCFVELRALSPASTCPNKKW